MLTTEFVSADGILHRNERTQDYIAFDPALERPLGVQLFGGDPDALAEAARAVIDWVQPDFIDLNFGCPVNKVGRKNGGSSLLRDCPLLERVALAVVEAVAAGHPACPSPAKIRIGWDEKRSTPRRWRVCWKTAASSGSRSTAARRRRVIPARRTGT